MSLAPHASNGHAPGGFARIQNAVLRDRSLSPSAKLLYCVGATYLINGAGAIHPSYKTLAGYCGFSRRTAIRAALELEQRGLWRIERRRDDGTMRSQTNVISYLEPGDNVTLPPSDRGSLPSDRGSLPSDRESPNQEPGIKNQVSRPPLAPPEGGNARPSARESPPREGRGNREITPIRGIQHPPRAGKRQKQESQDELFARLRQQLGMTEADSLWKR